jgi:hypothetical protein
MCGSAVIDVPKMIERLPKESEFMEHCDGNQKYGIEPYDYPDSEKHGISCYGAILELTECPGCILAIIRQAKVCIPGSHFDYKAACAEWWVAVNEDRREKELSAAYEF